MRRGSIALVLLLAVLLSACQKVQPAAGDKGDARGRYAGIGIFSPNKLWRHMAGEPEAAADYKSARLADDDVIIVVVDSKTGEVRECGNYSGRCVSINPWSKAVSGPSVAPVQFERHAAELSNESD